MLHNLNVSIKNKNIEEEGEGVVIYFLNQNYECLSLAKLKTLDCKTLTLFQIKFIVRSENHWEIVYNKRGILLRHIKIYKIILKLMKDRKSNT